MFVHSRRNNNYFKLEIEMDSYKCMNNYLRMDDLSSLKKKLTIFLLILKPNTTQFKNYLDKDTMEINLNFNLIYK